MELTVEALEKRLAELREAEGMAWAQLHGIQGRVMEAEYLLGLLKGETPDGAEPAVKLTDILPAGFREG